MSTPLTEQEIQSNLRAFEARMRNPEAKVDFYTGKEWISKSHIDSSASLIGCYRLHTEPKLRPWRPEEVPVGALMRTKGGNGVPWVILGVSVRNTIQFPGGDNAIHGDDFNQAMTLREHSIDHGKTWAPCGVMEDSQ